MTNLGLVLVVAYYGSDFTENLVTSTPKQGTKMEALLIRNTALQSGGVVQL